MSERPDGLIEGSGRAGNQRALKQMVSVRFEPPVLVMLREFADEKGLSISDVVRAAVLDYVEENSEVPRMCTWPLTWTGYTKPAGLLPVYGR